MIIFLSSTLDNPSTILHRSSKIVGTIYEGNYLSHLEDCPMKHKTYIFTLWSEELVQKMFASQIVCCFGVGDRPAGQDLQD